MAPDDVEVRNVTYGQIPALGRVPSSVDVAAELGTAVGDVRAAWRRLHDAHALVVDAATGEIRMAHPFSAVPTHFRVRAADRDWYANCAWDAFGICARSVATAPSPPRVPTAATPSSARCTTAPPTIPRCCSTASSRPPRGGTTSSSPEAR